MLFNSLLFLFFFPTVVLIYFLLPHKYRWLFLLIASYYFYMNWQPVYALLISFSVLTTWLCGILLDSSNNVGRRKIYLTISLIINFGILFSFKYFNFINNSVFSTLEYFNVRWEVPNLDVLLPVGISFYTFQAVGYTIDVYRKEIKAERHIGIYALFVTFFPQLVAGPIERSSNLLPQFREVKRCTIHNLSAGFKMVLWGFFLKIVMADRLGLYVDAVFNNVANHSGSSHALASFFFAFQIYGDFAGYSLIAIGVSKMMSFDLMTNFRRPYFATNITSFWSRWHISLSSWFKDYLYIPLGGNRITKKRTYFNLFLTFFVSGIWHGANFTFIVWGALHGLYSVIEKAMGLGFKKNSNKLSWQTLVSVTVTFILVDFAWIFFRANSLADALTIIYKIMTDFGSTLFVRWEIFFVATICFSILLFKEFTDEFFPNKFLLLNNKNMYIRIIAMALLLSLIILLGIFDSGQFIYFQF
jgi:alginate O-acetyltransferase complex protein AlgI